jgi:hypothetical protein
MRATYLDLLSSCSWLGMLPGTWAYVSAGAVGRAIIVKSLPSQILLNMFRHVASNMHSDICVHVCMDGRLVPLKFPHVETL